MNSIDSYEDLLRNDDALDAQVRTRLLEKGIIIHPRAKSRCHISAAHTEDDIAILVQAYADSIKESLRTQSTVKVIL